MFTTFVGAGVAIVSDQFVSFILRAIAKSEANIQLVMAFTNPQNKIFNIDVERVSESFIITRSGYKYKVAGWETRPLRFFHLENQFYPSLLLPAFCPHTVTVTTSESYLYPRRQENVKKRICLNCIQVLEKTIEVHNLYGNSVQENVLNKVNKELYRLVTSIVYEESENIFRIAVCPHSYFSYPELQQSTNLFTKLTFDQKEKAHAMAIQIEEMRRQFFTKASG